MNYLKSTVLTIIGMSGSGKTHLCRGLRGLGYEHVSCDDLIEVKLRLKLPKGGHSGIEGVARWMGQPYEAGYALRQAAYLDAECEVVREILTGMESGRHAKVVIDTTGSIVHIGEELCKALQAISTMVYIEIPSVEVECLYEEYIKNPKPVVWGDNFHRKPNESTEAALSRCYREFFQFRRALYEKYADITIPTTQIRHGGSGPIAFLELLSAHLGQQC